MDCRIKHNAQFLSFSGIEFTIKKIGKLWQIYDEKGRVYSFDSFFEQQSFKAKLVVIWK